MAGSSGRVLLWATSLLDVSVLGGTVGGVLPFLVSGPICEKAFPCQQGQFCPSFPSSDFADEVRQYSTWFGAWWHSALMPCFHPIDAFQRSDGQVVFVERGDIARPLVLPCGRCIGCRLEYSRQWAVRMMHEAQMHELSCFLTLTYDDAHLPVDESLHYADFQGFIRKLRRVHAPRRFSFYMCGEYGEQFKRPHYHACLFGLYFTDGVHSGTSRRALSSMNLRRFPRCGLMAFLRSQTSVSRLRRMLPGM